MKLFVSLLLFTISVSCFSSVNDICTKNEVELQVADFSLCIPSKKVRRIHTLPGKDTSTLVSTKKGTFLLSNLLVKNALNNLPNKIGLSNHDFLNLLFTSNEKPYSELKSAFFIDQNTKLKVAEFEGGFTYFLIDNGDI